MDAFMTLRDLLDTTDAAFAPDDLPRYHDREGRRNGVAAPSAAGLVYLAATAYERSDVGEHGGAVLLDVIVSLRHAANQINNCFAGPVPTAVTMANGPEADCPSPSKLIAM
jgi:hypothetical protein